MIKLQTKKRHLCSFGAVLASLLVAQSAARGEVTFTTVGTPGFEIVDTHVFAAATDAFPTFFPNHFPTRIVHAPPYTQEFAQGLSMNGVADKETFSVSDFTAPSAVHLGYALVPQADGPTGSTQDYEVGPIIPNAVLPITVQGDVFLNGALFEQGAFGSSLTPIDGFDGRSHFVVESWENSDFAPAGLASLVGDYEYRLTLRDVNDNGFDIVAQFAVVPEPSALAQLGIIGMTLAASVARRRPQWS